MWTKGLLTRRDLDDWEAEISELEVRFLVDEEGGSVGLPRTAGPLE